MTSKQSQIVIDCCDHSYCPPCNILGSAILPFTVNSEYRNISLLAASTTFVPIQNAEYIPCIKPCELIPVEFSTGITVTPTAPKGVTPPTSASISLLVCVQYSSNKWYVLEEFSTFLPYPFTTSTVSFTGNFMFDKRRYLSFFIVPNDTNIYTFSGSPSISINYRLPGDEYSRNMRPFCEEDIPKNGKSVVSIVTRRTLMDIIGAPTDATIDQARSYFQQYVDNEIIENGGSIIPQP